MPTLTWFIRRARNRKHEKREGAANREKVARDRVEDFSPEQTAFLRRVREICDALAGDLRVQRHPDSCIWEANNPDMLTRSMEFSNTPIHGTMKELIKAPELFGIPAYEWVDEKGKIAKRFAAFSARVAEGYKGVAEVRMAGPKLEIVERETGQLIKLDFNNCKL